MATKPVGGESAAVTLPCSLPPMPAVMRLLAQFDRDKFGAAIEVMVGLLDLFDPDPELEGSTWPEDVRADVREHHPDDCEAAGDEADAAWNEWHARGRHKLNPGATGPEDAEDEDPDSGVEDDRRGFDPEEDMCPAGDDGCGIVALYDGLHWGSEWEGEGEIAPIPVYGIDQSNCLPSPGQRAH